MLRNSFLIIEGIGKKREKHLWDLGITTWDDFLRHEQIAGIGKDKKKYFNRKLLEAGEKLLDGDIVYFSKLLPSTEHWRLYDTFKDECVYLDIETDGIGASHDVTVVGLYDGHQSATFVRGINFDERTLRMALKKYKLVVSFNGSVFDVPFLQKRYSQLFDGIAHMDLRFACERAGLTGGLKSIEKKLGIVRTNELVQKLHGGDAITLFRMFQGSGNSHFLDLLIEYNQEDVMNLEQISQKVVKKLIESSFFSPK